MINNYNSIQITKHKKKKFPSPLNIQYVNFVFFPINSILFFQIIKLNYFKILFKNQIRNIKHNIKI